MGKKENCMNFQPLFMCVRVLKVAHYIEISKDVYDKGK